MICSPALLFALAGGMATLPLPLDPPATMALNAEESMKLEALKAKAAQGDPESCFFLGNYTWEGKYGISKNPKEAMRLWRVSAEKGHVSSQWNLAKILSAGEQGVRKNVKEAGLWLKKAAAQSHPKALNLLGKCHEAGLGVEKDLNRALACYQAAAKLGIKEAGESSERVQMRLQKATAKKP